MEKDKTNRNRRIQQIAITVIIITVLTLATVLSGLPAKLAPTAPACSYAIPPEESGLKPTIYVDLNNGETMDLTFGELTKFHAECQNGFVRYWVTTIDQYCVRETIELLSDGTWSCTLNAYGMEALMFYIGDLWSTPMGEPPGGWTNPELNPLMTPVPTPLPGQQI